MRGKVAGLVGGWDASRITPAYAGKSFKETLAKSVFRDHPRLCGEKQYAYGKTLCRIGSPPPMRGKEPSSCPFAVVL